MFQIVVAKPRDLIAHFRRSSAIAFQDEGACSQLCSEPE
jgi:hypothetical protein